MTMFIVYYDRQGLDQLYSISYTLLGVIGFLNSVITGTIASFLTGMSGFIYYTMNEFVQ